MRQRCRCPTKTGLAGPVPVLNGLGELIRQGPHSPGLGIVHQRADNLVVQAMSSLRAVQQRYPGSEYAVDARVKLEMVQDQLAGKEMAVGRWYLREGQTLAAMGRFRTVVDRFQTTSHTPEALYRLVEANLTIGLMGEAQRTGAILGYNYPDDIWYGDAYRLLSDKGLQPAVAPLTPGAKRSFLQRVMGQKSSALPPPAETAPPPAQQQP